MSEKPTDKWVIHQDPPPGSCMCNCGSMPDGHINHVCAHDFSGWEEGEGYGTAVCVKCGMTAMNHDIWCGP